MKLISVVSSCFNEEENVDELCHRIKAVFQKMEGYDYEHIIADNASTDQTVQILRRIAGQDKRVKIIVNSRNFGHIRSPIHAILQASGEAVIAMVSDLQDPPELIPQFIEEWEKGRKIVIGVKSASEESKIFYAIRSLYYFFVKRLAEIDMVEHFTGFGLYDRQVIEILRQIDDPYPYFRGFICDIGFERSEIKYLQPMRKIGLTKNNFYTLYDLAMLGITNHSKVPLRLATFFGFLTAFVSLLVGLFYLTYKLFYWYNFEVGMAPLVIAIFFFAAVQLIFLGIIGEYVGSIHTQVQKRPLVVEKERINFD
jgi:glycosyltransferase involved in cell wall biosynthesis